MMLAAAVSAAAAPVFAQDAASGRIKAQACAVCHGPGKTYEAHAD